MGHIQGYWCIFSNNHRCVVSGRGNASSPFSFFENWKNWKKFPGFSKKGPDCVHLWVKFSIQNVLLRVSRRENSKMFPYRASFLVFLKHCLSKCPTPSPPPTCHTCKNSGWAPALRHSFCKMLHLKCLTMFWIQLFQ